MGNKISRDVKEIEVTFLTETNAGKENTKMFAVKTDYGWVGTDESGEKWQLLLQHLRNENYCKLRVIS